jgi:hypothetical protein
MSCSFSSTRTSKKCTDPVEVKYGAHGYCKKHSISVQALLVKQTNTPLSVAPNAPKVSKKIYDLVIKRNEYGNFTDENSGIVFNPLTKKVIGYEDEDGEVLPLSDEHKLLCVRRKWEIHEDSSDEDDGDTSDDNSDSSSSGSNSSSDS